MMIHTFSVLSLQLKKLRRHNKSAIDLSNASAARGHKKVRRSTVHHADNPQLQPTGYQNRDKILARSNHPTREHRKLIGVKTMFFGTNYSLYLVKYCQYLRIWITSYAEDCPVRCPSTKKVIVIRKFFKYLAGSFNSTQQFYTVDKDTTVLD